MGQEAYALLKWTAARFPAAATRALKESSGAFRVANVALPAVLIWTPINYHDLGDDDDAQESLRGQLLGHVPLTLLQGNAEPRGVLMFADGGEPRRRWDPRARWESLLDLEAMGTWVRFEEADLQAEPQALNRPATALDLLVEGLDVDRLTTLLVAQSRRDLAMARACLKTVRPKVDLAALESELAEWIERGG